MILSKATIKHAVTTSIVAAAVVLGPVFTAVVQAVPLSGAGATFPEPLYQRYFNQLRSKYPDIQVNYQGIGSGGGIRQLIAGSVEFAGSDTAMTDAEVGQVKNGGVLFVPTAGGPVAVVYNAPGVSNLKLSRRVLPAIFAGQITRWNDPKIATDNRGVNLPNLPIRLAVRADSSGTSYIFSNHLSTTDPYFKGRVGASKTPNWPGSPLKGKGNPGVAQIVKRTPGTIGYVESAYANSNKLQTALVQSKTGAYVAPTLAEANRALNSVQFNPDFRVNFTRLGDPAQGYPITGLTWITVYKKYQQAGEAAAVKRMVQWILTSGQQLNDDLGYTRIPANVANRVVQAVNRGVTGP